MSTFTQLNPHVSFSNLNFTLFSSCANLGAGAQENASYIVQLCHRIGLLKVLKGLKYKYKYKLEYKCNANPKTWKVSKREDHNFVHPKNQMLYSFMYCLSTQYTIWVSYFISSWQHYEYLAAIFELFLELHIYWITFAFYFFHCIKTLFTRVRSFIVEYLLEYRGLNTVHRYWFLCFFYIEILNKGFTEARSVQLFFLSIIEMKYRYGPQIIFVVFNHWTKYSFQF